jgi:predicted DNA-binding transcriptional regulator AlpA
MSVATTTLIGARLLSVKQVARKYGVTQQTIWRWEKKGRIPRGARLTSQTVRWREDVIDQHLSSLA